MGVPISPKRLELEMARRGWTSGDLARAAGVSGATITAARTGKPLSPRTVMALARALAKEPPVDGIDTLLA